MSTLTLVVTEIDDGIPSIRTLRLAAADGAALPSYPPGSHIVLECGPGGPANAYSLTGEGVAPADYVISVLACPDGAGGSRWIHGDLAVGDTVVARAPRSAFPPVLRARRHLLVAAGIGITPMVSHLRSARLWGRDARLLYIHREGRGAYLDVVKELTDHVAVFTDRSSFSLEVAAALASQPFGTHLYICGPPGFLDDVSARAVEYGWPPSRIHWERFGVDALEPGEPFEVELTHSGETFTVPSGVSLLQALHDRGYPVPNLCRQGVCGECRITVSQGEILHRDLYLTDADRDAGDSMMCCVSRAAGDRLELTLDVAQ